MFISKAALRYATALLEIAKELDQVEKVLEDIRLIDNTIGGSDDLSMFLASPIIKFDDKVNALDEIFSDKVQEVTVRFIKLLARKGRVKLLEQITQAFLQKYNEYAGIIEVDVYTARELNESQKSSLLEALEEKTDKKVDMTITEDASLKGGIAVRIDDTVIDGTVKHKLEELEEQFMNTAIE